MLRRTGGTTLLLEGEGELTAEGDASGVTDGAGDVKFSPGTSEDNEGIKWTDWGLNPGPPTY